MKIRLLTLIVFTVAIFYENFSYALTVNEVIEKVVNDSPELKIILEKRQQSLSDYKGAKASYLPSIYVDYLRTYTKSDPLNDPSVSNWAGSNKFQVILEQKIFDMQALASIAKSSYALQSQEFQNQTLLESLIQLAVTSYFDVIQAEYVYAVNNEFLQQVSNIEKLTYKMRTQGNATLGDVNLIQARLAEANTDSITSGANLDKVKARLSYLLNLASVTLDKDVSPSSLLPELTNKDFYDLSDKMVSFLPLTSYELEKQAIRNNVDVLLIRSNLCAAGYKLEEQKSRYLPTVATTVTLTNEDSSTTHAIDRTGKVELEARYFLYDGGARGAAVANAESGIRELEYTYDQKIRDLRDKAYYTFNQLKSLEQQRSSVLKQIAASEEVDRVYNQQFKFGTRNLTDRLDNIQRLSQARIKLISIDYSMLIVRMDILSLQGQFVEFFGFQNYLDYNKLNLC